MLSTTDLVRASLARRACEARARSIPSAISSATEARACSAASVRGRVANMAMTPTRRSSTMSGYPANATMPSRRAQSLSSSRSWPPARSSSAGRRSRAIAPMRNSPTGTRASGPKSGRCAQALPWSSRTLSRSASVQTEAIAAPRWSTIASAHSPSAFGSVSALVRAAPTAAAKTACCARSTSSDSVSFLAVMSRKATTAPTVRPSRWKGEETYSTGKTVPSRRVNTSSVLWNFSPERRTPSNGHSEAATRVPPSFWKWISPCMSAPSSSSSFQPSMACAAGFMKVRRPSRSSA